MPLHTGDILMEYKVVEQDDPKLPYYGRDVYQCKVCKRRETKGYDPWEHTLTECLQGRFNSN